MDFAYLSPSAALAGSAIGGLTSLGASWLTQRVQVSAQQLAHASTGLLKLFPVGTIRAGQGRFLPVRAAKFLCFFAVPAGFDSPPRHSISSGVR